MILGGPFYILAAFVLLHMTCKAYRPAQCSRGEESIFGKMLKGHIFKRLKVSAPIECLQACNSDFRCQSFNYVITQDQCELNNRTKEARPEDFVPNHDRYYFKRNREPGKLMSGTILQSSF